MYQELIASVNLSLTDSEAVLLDRLKKAQKKQSEFHQLLHHIGGIQMWLHMFCKEQMDIVKNVIILHRFDVLVTIVLI